MSATREWLVEGRVQGVAFRASARRRALELGVDGIAENLPDGRVRVIGRGEPDALDRFADWLADGPPAARVDALTPVRDRTDANDDVPATGFAIR